MKRHDIKMLTTIKLPFQSCELPSLQVNDKFHESPLDIQKLTHQMKPTDTLYICKNYKTTENDSL